MPYDHQSIETKWQRFWDENQTFAVTEDTKKPKKFLLDMFPYPSGAGLHVGHPKWFTATDILARYYHASGYNVLHPMGFDAFGLPAENYAIKTGTHPAITTAENVETFISQLKSLGFNYDWNRMVDTTDPEYYKWTQWIFLELFKRGLAYEQDLPINYCPSCKTWLANEEVLSDNTCDRCGTKVERRPIRQWVLRITDYADRLLDDLEWLDWPEGIKEMQRNWIGKSEGCEFEMMKKVEWNPIALILHGWEDEWNTSVTRHWQNWMKGKLQEMGYDVHMPELPGFDNPDIETQLAFLEQYSEDITEDSVIIWYSMGGLLAMNFVEKLWKKIDQLICIAPAFNGVKEFAKDMSSWDFAKKESQKAWWNSLEYCYDISKVQENTRKMEVFLSDTDPWIPHESAKNHFSIEGINVRVINNGGHFLERDWYSIFPELLNLFDHIDVYTTRVDTVYGMTYAVLAPDHPHVEDFITAEQRSACEAYIADAKSKSDQDRTADNKEKTGVFTGSYVVNPYNSESVPLWIADYVLGHYGTGAVMAVPAHDERDGEFARKYNLPIKQSIAPSITMSWKNAPKDGLQKTERKTVNAIIEFNGQYLVLKEPENYRLLWGGIESDETSLDTIKREITEETGYFDFADIQEISFSQVFAHGFHHKKQHNNESHDMPCFYVRLGTLGQKEVDPSKLAWHSIVWVEKNEVAKLLSFEQHQFQWKQFLDGDAYTLDGKLVNSSHFDWFTSVEARRVLTEKAESEGFGSKKVNYKLRDWLFSRQRYWGEPIPLIHISHEDYMRLPRVEKMEDAKMGEASILSSWGTKDLLGNGADSSHTRNDKNVPTESLVIDGQIFSGIYDGINGKIIIDSRLPITLPNVERYEPAGDGQSPLATVPDWFNVKLADNLTGKRETNTMPQWGGSCWYYLRYMDNKNSDALAGQEALAYWNNVDEYVGGAEHAVLHLLYARFWHKVLYDAGIVPTKEPFHKLVNQGMILAYAYERHDGGLVAVDLVEEVSSPPVKGGGEAGGLVSDKKIFIEKSTGLEVKQVVAKMSKSLKNVVNPNDIVREYGADTLRLYEMNMGAFTDTAPWNPDAIVGVRRFLDKAYSAYTDGKNTAKDDMKAMKLLHKTVKKIGEDIVGYKFNTAISALMILLNEGIPTDAEFASEWKEKFAILLHPFAPHMAEELYQLTESRKHKAEVANNSTLPTANCQLPTERSVYFATWPEYDEFMLVDDEVTIAIQVNGKLRGTYTGLNGVMQDEVSTYAHENPDIAKWLEGKTLIKEIFIPNKMLSIVVRDNEKLPD